MDWSSNLTNTYDSTPQIVSLLGRYVGLQIMAINYKASTSINASFFVRTYNRHPRVLTRMGPISSPLTPYGERTMRLMEA